MNARIALTRTVAAGALAAAAAAAMAHPPMGRGWSDFPYSPTASAMPAGRHLHGPGPRSGSPQENARARLDALKAAVNPTAAQQPAWDAYASRVLAQAEANAALREGLRSRAADPDALAEFRVTALKQRAQAAEEILALRRSLVAVLTPEQKAAFDRFGSERTPMRGHGAGPRAGCARMPAA